MSTFILGLKNPDYLVMSSPNHFTEISFSVPSSRMDFSAAFTSA
jgi:hypothetical protein